MTDKKNLDLLRKIAKLAREGVGGEKTAAQSRLKKLCEKHGLDYERTLNQLILEEYEIDTKAEGLPMDVVLGVFARYGIPEGWDGHYSRSGTRWLYVKTTKDLYDKAMAMLPSVRVRFEREEEKMKIRHRQEKKLFNSAFKDRTKLYYPHEFKRDDSEDLANSLTKQEIDELRARMEMAQRMDSKPLDEVAGLLE